MNRIRDAWFRFNVGVQITDEEKALLTENNEHAIAFLEAHEATKGLLYNRALMNRVSLKYDRKES